MFQRLICAASVVVAATAAQAQVNGFDARKPCGEIIRGASDIDKMMIAAWAFGYLGAAQDDIRPVDLENNKTILRNIIGVCGKDESRSLLEIVARSTQGDASTPGSGAQAEAVLRQFLAADADRAALTAALKPGPADIAAVYAEPLAGRLMQMYDAMYQPGAAIGPKPGQTALILVHATTASLKRGDAVLREFPGGYQDVLQYFAGDHPIVRFKFVEDGATTGMAFDGLVFVNGRWVLMPKPWRALQ